MLGIVAERSPVEGIYAFYSAAINMLLISSLTSSRFAGCRFAVEVLASLPNGTRETQLAAPKASKSLFTEMFPEQSP